MSTDTLIRRALDAGVELRFVDGQLRVAGRRSAVAAWAPQLALHKAVLIEALQSPAIDWHTLDRAYQAHHWQCPTCQAAGRGRSYGLRCGTGAALWNTYINAPIQKSHHDRTE